MKEHVIKTLGNHYSRKIIEYLKKKGIKNADGGDFSNNSLYPIVNGLRKNEEVETAITELLLKTVKKQERKAEKMKRLTAKIYNQ